MNKVRLSFKLLPLFLFISLLNISAQNLVLPENFPEFNITENNLPDEAYLFLTIRDVDVRVPASLVISDNYGTPVFYLHMPKATGGFSLKSNGLLAYRTRVTSVAKFYLMDSSFVIVDSVGMVGYKLDSHDFLALESGNFIIFGIDQRATDLTAFGGLADAQVKGCVIQELDANKNVIFEWNSWDHFEVTDTYNDLTVSLVDQVHPNSLEIDYDGNILLISRGMNEVTKIDRVTGDIIWRLGGKNNQFTFGDSTQMFSKPHDFRLLENGNYTIFDNGNEKDPAYSRAVEYVLDDVNMTIDLVWEYDADKELYGVSGGSTRRLPSGNTLLGYGGTASWPSAIEVHPDGSKALQLDFIENLSSARVLKAPWRTTLFEPNTYQINFGEWDGYTTSEYLLNLKNNEDHIVTLTGYSTRTDAFAIDESFPVDIPAHGDVELAVTFFPSTIEHGYITDVLTIDSDINSDTLIRRVSQQIQLKGTQIDLTAPVAILLEDGTEEVDLEATFTIEFSEPVRMLNEDIFSYATIDEIISFKLGDLNGEDMAFDAVINSAYNRLSIIPEQALDLSQNYYIVVSDQFSDFSGNQGDELVSQFTTGVFTEIELVRQKKIELYPNPGTGIYQLRFTETDDYLLQVYDMTGKIVVQEQSDLTADYVLDISYLSDGIYFLRIVGENSGDRGNIRLIKE